jgi:hypothetical protein
VAGELSIRPVGVIVNHGVIAERKAMIDRTHALPTKRQVQLTGISRGSVSYLMKRMGIEVLDRKPNTGWLCNPRFVPPFTYGVMAWYRFYCLP